MEQVLVYVLPVLTSVVTALLISSVTMRLVTRRAVTVKTSSVLSQLGFSNIKPKDLNDVTNEGFGRFIHLIREIKAQTVDTGQIGQLMQLAQLGSAFGGQQRPVSFAPQPAPAVQQTDG